MFITNTEVAQNLIRDCEDAIRINDNNLKKLLADNCVTEYGKRFSFSSIRSAEEYAEKVPLSEYDAYEGVLNTPGGSTVYPTFVTLASSGTTGNQKLFPLTKEALYRYSSFSLSMAPWATKAEGKILHTNVFRSPVNGLTILSNAHLTWLRHAKTFDFSNFVGGEECYFSDGIKDVFYLKSFLMLATPDLTGIVSIFLYDLVLLLSYMENNLGLLLSDFRSGTVSSDLPQNVKEILLSLRPDEERIAEIERVFAAKADGPIVPRLWKDVKYVIGLGGRMYRFQEEILKQYIGSVPVNYSIYASSECMMGVAPGMSEALGQADYVLLPRCAFYEFLTKKDCRLVQLKDLAIGEEYEPVITTFSGLYRYRTGDLIRVNSFKGQAPMFEVVGRRTLMINIAGEKTGAAVATEAVRCWAKRVGISPLDFTIGIDPDPAHIPSGYCLFVEAENAPEDLHPEIFDECLKEGSFDYEDLRGLGAISRPQVFLVPRGEIFNSITVGDRVAHKKPRVFVDRSAEEYLIGRSILHG